MIRSNLLVCATGSSIDRETNRLSLFNLLEDTTVVVLPVILQEVNIAAFLERDITDPDQIELTASFKSADDLSGPLMPINVSFNGALRIKIVVNVQGVFIPVAGRWE